jgi:hypothetical protein
VSPPDKLQNNLFKGHFVKILGLVTLVLSANAFSLDLRYPQALLDQAQDAICNSEDSSRAMKLAEAVQARVKASFEAEAKTAKLSVEDYLNKKETHDAFLVSLKQMSDKQKLEEKGQAEFMILSLEMGMRFQTLATVRFPSISMIDQASEVLVNLWLPIGDEISANPKGCSSGPQVNSSERGSIDKTLPSNKSSSPSAPSAVGQ